jgi:hypothetical protein
MIVIVVPLPGMVEYLYTCSNCRPLSRGECFDAPV